MAQCKNMASSSLAMESHEFESRKSDQGVNRCSQNAHAPSTGRRTSQTTWIAIGFGACFMQWLFLAWSLPSRSLLTSVLNPKSYRNDNVGGWTLPPPAHPMIFRDVLVIFVFALVGYCVTYQKQCFLAVPHLHVVAPPPPPPGVGALLAAALYGANIAYNVLNKRMLDRHPYPLLVTCVNFGTCSMCCIAAWILGLQKPMRLSYSLCGRLVPVVFLHWTGILAANTAVAEVNIAFTHTIKAAEPLFTAATMLVFMGARPSLEAWASLLVLVIGVCLASTTDVSFTWVGLYSALASNLIISLRTVLSKQLINAKVQDPLNFTAILHCGSFLMSLPVTLMVEGRHLPELFSARECAGLPLIGVLVWIFNIASIMILSKTSPVTHSMIRTLRRPMLVIASIVAFGTTVEPLNIAGILMAFLGAWLYNNSRMMPSEHCYLGEA